MHPLVGFGRRPRSPRDRRRRSRLISATMAAEDLLHRQRDLADRRLGARRIDARAASRLPLPRAPSVSALERRLRLGFVALGAQPLQLLDLLRAHRRVVDLQHVDSRSIVGRELVDADHRLAAGIDARLRARGGLLDAAASAGPARSPWPCRRAPRSRRCGFARAPQARRSGARHSRSRPRDR